MEITIDLLDLQFYEEIVPLGRYNIHCKVETREGSFTNSSIFVIEETGTPNGRKITQGSTTSVSNWLQFNYEFQRTHKEPVISLQLSDLTDVNNQKEIAQGLVPLRLKPGRKETINRTAYLVTKVDDLPLVQQAGRINIQVIVNYRQTNENESEDMSVQETVDTNVGDMPGWTQTESAQSHLLFLSASVHDTHCQSVGGESLISDHFELLDTNFASFPQIHPVITVLFHFYATEDFTASYHVISYLNLSSKAKELVTNTPFAMWNLDPTHDRRFQYANILSQRNHLLIPTAGENNDEQLTTDKPQLLGLMLIKDSRPNKPVFTAFENIAHMSPFTYIHHAWLTDTFKPTVPSDPLREATKHIVTSLHYTPPLSSYSEYNGLEIAIMRFHLEQQKDYIISIEAIHQDNYTNRKEPPFLNSSNESLSEYKLAYVQLRSDEVQNPSVYFFCKSQAILDTYRPVSNHSTLLVLQIYTIDPSSVQPWWTGDITCSMVRSIDQRIYTILKDDIAQNGLRWRIDWEDLNWSIDVVLRLKTPQMEFLQPMSNDELYKLPVLENTEHDDSQSLTSTIIPTINIKNDEQKNQKDKIANKKQDHTVDSIQYLEIITKLTDQIEKLQEDNARLQQENGYLQGLIQQPNATTTVHWSLDHQLTQLELQKTSRAELISKVLSFQEALEIEIGHKERYQQKVFEVQNELLSIRSKERQFLKLQEAHKLQQKLVQDLQHKVKKYFQCYQTMLQQEKVIKQLEGLLFEQKEEKSIAKIMSKKSSKTSNSLPTIQENIIREEDEEMFADSPHQQGDVFVDSSDIEERLIRLEEFTNQSHINQINIESMLKESAARERHLRQSLMATKASMDNLKTENRELKRNVLGLLNIRPQPPNPSGGLSSQKTTTTRPNMTTSA